MALNNLAELLEKRRTALVEYCLGQVKESGGKYNFLRTPADLFELLRMDPLDSYPVQSSWVAEATSCAQQFIHAAFRKLEPGYEKIEFDKRDLATWELYNNYPDWAALQLIAIYPENFINPFVRRRKTSLFKALENNLNQTRLNADSVQAALQDYLQSFEQICNLDVISGYMDGATADRADYYFVGRQRVPPFQYFWRKAEVELSATCAAINPAAWSEWQPADIPAGAMVLDMRPVFWSGRLCLVWAQWQAKVQGQEGSEGLPARLDINVSFMAQNGNWSAPLSLHSSARDQDPPPQGARLVATVWADPNHPQGRLGVMLIGVDPEVFAVRDVLFRPVDWDDGGWLEKAVLYRFTTAETVQHPLTNQPTMVISDAASGSLTPYLGFQAVAFRVGNDDKLFVQGFCRPTGLTGDPVILKLELDQRAGDDPDPIEQEFAVAGGWSTQWLELTRGQGSWQDPVFLFGDETGGPGQKRFKLTIKNVTDFPPVTLSKNTLDAAQFLSLNQSGLNLKYTRLNSLFGPELVQRSNISVDAVLDWDTQFLSEPPPLGVPDFSEPNGAFNGANGLFFWELFFHLPHLVTARLNAEDRFLEAQNWLHYLFDPQAPADLGRSPVDHPKPLYWRCRPLYGPGNLGCEADAPTDPDAIGYSAPRHFQIVVFTEYVKNLIAWGDWYYRQLTRESLVAAKLCYVQAEFLMGKAPEVRTVNRWETNTVEGLLNKSASRPALEQFEKELVFSLADFPATAEAPPLLGLLANEPFKAPINEQLLAVYDLPGQRLYNLRNNLTLDGKPLDIPLFSPPTDPNQLLRDLAAGSGGARPMGGRLVVGAFRWRVTFETALRAVQSLQEHGSQVLHLLEQRDRAEQEEMQQNHLVELGSYAQTVQEQSITQLQASTAALEQSRAMAQERAEAYARRYDENVSEVEYQVMENLQLSKKLELASSIIKPAGAVVASLPTIFGMANGGHRLDKTIDAVSFVLSVAASAMQIDADKQATTEGYRRRREEWQLQRDQALAEVRAIDAQITAQTHALQAAQTTLAQTLKANSQALTVYNFIKKRASNAELFGWLLGQLKALHYQAYDAVVSLCLGAQAALTAETGDYDAQIPLPQVWLDNRHGLTAGEHLHGHLLRMEREYLQRHERRMELVKTVSLRRLFDDSVERQAGVDGWAAALAQLRGQGMLEFALTQLLFDRDHPGHYCRQISSIEVDLPVLTGPFENVRATLLQIGSMIATKASLQSVRYLHHPTEFVAPSDVLFNLRSGQQIALSVGLGDSGMTAMKPDEGLLNPFENTGVVSRWMLKFPWPNNDPQLQMLASLTDIIVRIRYTAKAGEPTFIRAVEDRVVEAETPDRLNPLPKE
ncbi:neuraminidase-like domain-containing protein [Pseudomonas sp. Z4-20]|uniref:Tc toxin subunit A-related protein n=1 Tax=Pseudomonas sp. Z4-20 TaxID=2817414 RepID=UPI003DA94AA0